jgi:hypothetical protein
MERSTIFNGKIHYKWSFSIATLNYQRVTLSFSFQVSMFLGSPASWQCGCHGVSKASAARKLANAAEPNG